MAWQVAAGVACLVPLLAGALGVWRGVDFIAGVDMPPPADLDSHFRYLSGIFLGVGLAFAWCIPGIERKTGLFRLLCGLVVLGGLARLWSAASLGLPSFGHRFGLVMELVVVPWLFVWQTRVVGRLG